MEHAVLRAFSDMRRRQLRPAIDVVGDQVAVELAVNAVNDGPLQMPDGELPAGGPISFETGMFWQIGPDVLITEERSYFDATGVAAQLGITPNG